METLLKFKATLQADEDANYEQLVDCILSCDEKATSNHFGLILPLTLSLTDHHQTSNSLLGLDCIVHILKTMSPNDIKANNTDALLLHVLSKLLIRPEEELIEKLLPPLLKVVQLAKFNPLDIRSTKVDDLFSTIITQISLRSEHSIKCVYWRCMPAYFSFMDISIVKYSKDIVNLISEQLSYPLKDCNDLFFDLLTCLKIFLTLSNGPFRFTQQLTFDIVKFLIASEEEIQLDSKLVQLITEVLKLLSNKDRILFSQYVEAVIDTVPDNLWSKRMFRNLL